MLTALIYPSVIRHHHRGAHGYAQARGLHREPGREDEMNVIITADDICEAMNIYNEYVAELDQASTHLTELTRSRDDALNTWRANNPAASPADLVIASFRDDQIAHKITVIDAMKINFATSGVRVAEDMVAWSGERLRKLARALIRQTK